MDNVLVLVRHGESEWNKLNLFTGWRDPGLTETGIAEAHRAGKLLKAQGRVFDIAYTSVLTRAQITLEIMLEELGQQGLETIKDQALNERHYGDLCGLNKDDARKKWGDEQVHIWRRSYDVPPPSDKTELNPEGMTESLKDTAARTLPFFNTQILPLVQKGQNILVAAHGNSLRSIVMELDNLTKEQVLELNIATGTPLIYEIDSTGRILSKASKE